MNMDETEIMPYPVEISKELQAEQDKLEEMIIEAGNHGFLYDTHLEPLAIAIGYLESPETIQAFYNMMANPGLDWKTCTENIDPLLTLYASRRESIYRNGLAQSINTLGNCNVYCTLQMLPLSEKPIISGLEEIFGQCTADKLSSDPSYIPLDRTYVCCCHNLTENRIPSRIFLVGSQETMDKLVPGTMKISEEITLEELCPYKPACPFKKAYADLAEKPSIRLITDPLESSVKVFQNRVENHFGREVYEYLVTLAQKINIVNDKLNANDSDPYGINGRELNGEGYA
jgi:hypothetical protein